MVNIKIERIVRSGMRVFPWDQQQMSHRIDASRLQHNRLPCEKNSGDRRSDLRTLVGATD
jgi:hypothetical protein